MPAPARATPAAPARATSSHVAPARMTACIPATAASDASARRRTSGPGGPTEAVRTQGDE